MTGNYICQIFLNEEAILINDSIFSREALQEYVTHPEKKLNKHKK